MGRTLDEERNEILPENVQSHMEHDMFLGFYFFSYYNLKFLCYYIFPDVSTSTLPVKPGKCISLLCVFLNPLPYLFHMKLRRGVF